MLRKMMFKCSVNEALDFVLLVYEIHALEYQSMPTGYAKIEHGARITFQETRSATKEELAELRKQERRRRAKIRRGIKKALLLNEQVRNKDVPPGRVNNLTLSRN